MLANKEPNDTLNSLRNDEYLSQFLITAEENRNENVGFIVCHSLTASEQLSKLSKGIISLEKEIQDLTVEHHDKLITQNLWLENFDTKLPELHEFLESMIVSVENVHRKITDPLDKIKMQCTILSRLHETCDMLRCVTKIQQLMKHLPIQDNVKLSLVVRDIDDICQTVDLADLNILEHDLQMIKAEKLRIQNVSKETFIKGLQELDKPPVNTAIQIFNNLRVLNEVIREFMENITEDIIENIQSSLDTRSLSQSTEKIDQEKLPKSKNVGPGKITGGTFPGVSVQSFRSKLWSNWNNLLDTVIYPKCVQIYTLESIIRDQIQLHNTRDVPRIEIKDVNLASIFWNDLSTILSKQLSEAAEGSSFIKQALEGEYPRLLRFHLELNKKLTKFLTKSDDNKLEIFPFVYSNQFASKFENAYLSRSLSRLVNNVENMFLGEELPTKEKIDSFVNSIRSELGVSLLDESLNISIVRNIEKAVRLFLLKSEQLLRLQGDFTQVFDSPNYTQKLNTDVANTAYYLRQQIQATLHNMQELPASCSTHISKMLENVDKLTDNILTPLCDTIAETVESIILTMHEESFERESDDTGSLYLKELQVFIRRAVMQYLHPFAHKELLRTKCFAIASRSIDLLIRHACLVRPISKTGRLILAADFAYMETALTPLCERLAELGQSYKMLRAVGSFICLEPEQIEDSEVLGDVIPYSLALMFLFSYAPPEMLSPHKCCDWSIARLSRWLDNHTSEYERLELISGSLQKYHQMISHQFGKAPFHEIYMIMRQLLEDGYELLSKK